MFYICIYHEIITTVKLINTPITSHSYTSFFKKYLESSLLASFKYKNITINYSHYVVHEVSRT